MSISLIRACKNNKGCLLRDTPVFDCFRLDQLTDQPFTGIQIAWKVTL